MTQPEQIAAVDWTLDRTFPEIFGKVIRVLQREVALEPASVQEELKPFCCLPTLLKYYLRGRAALYRGMVSDPEFAGNCMSLGVRTDDESGPLIRVRLEGVETIRLTVWRVNEELDALQLNLDSPTGWLYLQTGGELLLDLMLPKACSTVNNSLMSVNEHFLANSRSPVKRTT